MTRVSCVQFAPEIGDLAGNAARAQAAIDQAIVEGAQVVVLPELASSGYMFEDTAEAEKVAIGRADPILSGWQSAAVRGRAVVAGGFCELGDDGQVYNSAVIFDGSRGEAAECGVCFYRKLHLWDHEKLVFGPGSEFPPVIETTFGRIAVIVCYDLEFPELTRALALAGTQLLLVPTNWPLVQRPSGERPPEVQVAIAAARVNRMAIACADRCRTERGQEWTQGSSIVSVDGWVVAESRDEVTITADLDLDTALDKQLTEHAHAFNDRRPEFYTAVAEPTGGRASDSEVDDPGQNLAGLA